MRPSRQVKGGLTLKRTWEPSLLLCSSLHHNTTLEGAGLGLSMISTSTLKPFLVLAPNLSLSLLPISISSDL